MRDGRGVSDQQVPVLPGDLPGVLESLRADQQGHALVIYDVGRDIPEHYVSHLEAPDNQCSRLPRRTVRHLYHSHPAHVSIGDVTVLREEQICG